MEDIELQSQQIAPHCCSQDLHSSGDGNTSHYFLHHILWGQVGKIKKR